VRRDALRATAAVLALLPVLLWTWLPLPLHAHLLGSIALCAVAVLVARHLPAYRFVVPVLSVAATARYMAWRLDGTVLVEASVHGAASLLLLGAEAFGSFLLLAGYAQTAFARPSSPSWGGGAPPPRNAPPTRWPTVDVMVPTYDEPVGILRATLVGALAMDYPAKRVYLLDEQRRPEMKALCEELGATWVTRPDNAGAKAGNLNHALARSDGELVAVFDADQVPVRTFLRTAVPPFLDDPTLALVQTPHHFYNPDPFERNLRLEDEIPAEHLVFYHLIQVGNDFWNSAFFCGSCAVLRRSALAEVGGIATETVTEDAHTAMKMHARGWNSTYVPIPQAAGLATERYAFHVTQRIRWARGMLQILRLDNPLLRRGLSFGQRLGYLGATAHFLFGVPRLVYLLAPPAYLLFGVHPLEADASVIAAYAAPHVMLSVLGSSTVSHAARHSFWAEIHELAIAPYVAVVALLTMLSPRHARFKVTTKGARTDRLQLDARRAAPNLVIGALLLGALAVTPLRWAGWPGEQATVALAAAWNLYNLLLLGPAVAVALDRSQRRGAWRVHPRARIRVERDGAVWHGRVLDLAEDGIRAWGQPVEAPPWTRGDSVRVRVSGVRDVPVEVDAVVRDSDAGADGTDVRLQLSTEDPRARRAILEEMFTGASSWLPTPMATDRPLRALGLLARAPWRAVTAALTGARA
jgi:cellulose synthase (UDP-forming)